MPMQYSAVFNICKNGNFQMKKCNSSFAIAFFRMRSDRALGHYQHMSLTILRGCTAQYVSNLVGDPEDRFCCDEARLF